MEKKNSLLWVGTVHWGRTDFSFRFLRSFSRRKAVKMVVFGHICAWDDVSARVMDAS